MSAPPPRRLPAALATTALAALTALAFLPVRENGFLSLDDPLYLTGNPQVRRGLTAGGARWALDTFHAANWHPLTWLSHMLDVQLFGLDPRAHHLVSLALHSAATVLLFAFLARATGSRWRGFFAAALFALHPLRVESVAWASERKDVLAAFFWMLCLLAYARYAARPGTARFLAVLAALGLGLMSKPSLVALPAVLLILDWWPLARFRGAAGVGAAARRLLTEKLILLLPALGALALTFAAQRAGETIRPVSWAARLENVPAHHLAYLRLTVWPDRLYIPHLQEEEGAGGGTVLAGALLLAALTLAAWRLRRGFPFLASGWLWYLAASAPTIGLVQLVNQSVADRYTYLPSAGLAVAAVWATARLRERGVPGAALAVGGLVLLGLLAQATRSQVRHWRDDLALFGHTAAMDPGNFTALLNTGTALYNSGRYAEALERYRALVARDPRFVPARFFLGNTLAALGRDAEALAQWERVVELAPLHVEARLALAEALLRQGRPAEAATQLSTVLGLRPGDPRALGAMREAQGARAGGAAATGAPAPR